MTIITFTLSMILPFPSDWYLTKQTSPLLFFGVSKTNYTIICSLHSCESHILFLHCFLLLSLTSLIIYILFFGWLSVRVTLWTPNSTPTMSLSLPNRRAYGHTWIPRSTRPSFSISWIARTAYSYFDCCSLYPAHSFLLWTWYFIMRISNHNFLMFESRNLMFCRTM